MMMTGKNRIKSEQISMTDWYGNNQKWISVSCLMQSTIQAVIHTLLQRRFSSIHHRDKCNRVSFKMCQKS